jgi:peptidoglycan-N-acetylglucosamine deacetylase
VGAEKAAAGVTRRVLLTAGGLTVLGIYATVRADPIPDAVRDPATRRGQATLANAVNGGDRRVRPEPATRTLTRRQAARPEPVPTRQAKVRLAAARGDAGPAGEPMRYLDDGPKAIALTIDDGPSPVYTPQILGLLEKYRVTATFSMIGIEARAYPGVARDVAAAGHLIANHTWTHLNLQWLSPVVVADQMDRATAAIHAATGRTPHLFRAPYGAWSPVVLQRCAEVRMIPLGWSVDPRDWSRPGVPAIIANIMRNTRGRSIILEHDGGGNRSETVAALKYVIPRLLAAGYRFRTP